MPKAKKNGLNSLLKMSSFSLIHQNKVSRICPCFGLCPLTLQIKDGRAFKRPSCIFGLQARPDATRESA